ncbi:hypothetical protein [Janthinobacterium lividum]|jgi:hypothetical protein
MTICLESPQQADVQTLLAELDADQQRGPCGDHRDARFSVRMEKPLQVAP